MGAIESSLAHEILVKQAEQSSTGTEISTRLDEAAEQIGNASAIEDGDLDLQIVEEALRETSRDVRTVVGGRHTKVYEGSQAGEALQGVPGTATIDVTSAVNTHVPGTSIIDTTNLQDIVDHEAEHERQAKEWNAEEVEIVGLHSPLTRKFVSEVGAMSVQATIAHNSAEYREMWRTVTSVTTAESARQTARDGDLKELAREINASKQLAI